MKVGIIGNGFCGQATNLLKCNEVEVLIYDRIPSKCIPEGLMLCDLVCCDMVFICINTPLTEDNKYNTIPIDKLTEELRLLNYDNLVLRSTVTPDYFDTNNITYFPEFLTEENWELDFINCKNWIIGSNGDDELNNNIIKLLNICYTNGGIKYNNIHLTTNKCASLCKLMRNSYLAAKVSFFNEMYNICKVSGIDYDNDVRELITYDERIGKSHTIVPYKGKYGYGGSCFPKDLLALSNYSKKMGNNTIILDSVNYRNEMVDAPKQEWRNDSRAYVKMK